MTEGLKRGIARYTLAAGLAVTATSAVLLIIALLGALYRRPLPGDEGGISYVVFLRALLWLPPGLLLTGVGCLLRSRMAGRTRVRLTAWRLAAALLLGAGTWAAVLFFRGRIFAGWWPEFAAAFAMALSLPLSRPRHGAGN